MQNIQIVYDIETTINTAVASNGYHVHARTGELPSAGGTLVFMVGPKQANAQPVAGVEEKIRSLFPDGKYQGFNLDVQVTNSSVKPLSKVNDAQPNLS